MGHFARYHCPGCRYEEPDLAYGRGARAEPHLVLFRCLQCKSAGAAWVEGDATPQCSLCYEALTEWFDEPPGRLACPKCGEHSAAFERLPGDWQ